MCIVSISAEELGNAKISFQHVGRACDAPDRGNRAAANACVDPARSGALAGPERRLAGRGHHDRHGGHGQRIPRARAQQQRARAGKYRAAAHPALRPAVRGLRDHKHQPDRPDAVFRDGLARDLQEPDVDTRRAPGAEIQGQRAVLYRRRQHLRCGRNADQFVGTMAGTRRRHRRPGLFQILQIEPPINAGPGRTGSQYLYRRLDHGDRPSPERSRRGISGRDVAADRPCQFRKILRVRRARKGRRDCPVPPRWNDAGAASSCRFDDREEIQDRAAAGQGSGRGWPSDHAGGKSRQS